VRECGEVLWRGSKSHGGREVVENDKNRGLRNAKQEKSRAREQRDMLQTKGVALMIWRHRFDASKTTKRQRHQKCWLGKFLGLGVDGKAHTKACSGLSAQSIGRNTN
jgi:hypothetical protein